MTREEAIRAVTDVYLGNDMPAAAFIDRLVVLGLLKLEEPETPESRFRDVLAMMDPMIRHNTAEVLAAVKAAGLRIVDAKGE